MKCEEIKNILRDNVFKHKQYTALNKSVTEFYNNAFKPEFINALEYTSTFSFKITLFRLEHS